jgi:hypothetical protein
MSKWRSGFAAGTLLALLTGCAIGGQLQVAETTRSEPVLRLTTSGLGPVGAGASYSTKSLGAALPGFQLDTVKTMNEGQMKWLIAAFKDGLQQVQFEPNGRGNLVERLHVVGREAAGPYGERIGMTFAETGGLRMSCSAGKAHWAGIAICQGADKEVTYMYALQGEQASATSLPAASEMAAAPLVRMIWKAP